MTVRIAGLFDAGDTSPFAALDALRTVPTKRLPTELYRHLDRLDAVRAFNLRPPPPRGVPAATLERLARVARIGKPSAIAALQEPRRTATIAALFHTLEAAAQDDAAELAEALLTDMVKDAEAASRDGAVGSDRRRLAVPVTALTQLAEADAFRPSLALARREALWAIKALRDEPLPLFAAAAARARS